MIMTSPNCQWCCGALPCVRTLGSYIFLVTFSKEAVTGGEMLCRWDHLVTMQWKEVLKYTYGKMALVKQCGEKLWVAKDVPMNR